MKLNQYPEGQKEWHYPEGHTKGVVCVDREGLRLWLAAEDDHLSHLVEFKFRCGCERALRSDTGEGLKWVHCELWQAYLRLNQAKDDEKRAEVAHAAALTELQKRLRHV
jgi:hypothetical protein